MAQSVFLIDSCKNIYYNLPFATVQASALSANSAARDACQLNMMAIAFFDECNH